MQDLYVELQQKRKELSEAITILKERGKEKAEAEREYRVALAQEIITQRAEKTPVTIINDICRGKEEIAELKMKRDIAETYVETAQQKIYEIKINMNIIQNQIEAERKGM